MILVALSRADKAVFDRVVLHRDAVPRDPDAIPGKVVDDVSFAQGIRRAQADGEAGVQDVVVTQGEVGSVPSKEHAIVRLDPVLCRPLGGVLDGVDEAVFQNEITADPALRHGDDVARVWGGGEGRADGQPFHPPVGSPSDDQAAELRGLPRFGGDGNDRGVVAAKFHIPVVAAAEKERVAALQLGDVAATRPVPATSAKARPRCHRPPQSQ